MPIVDPSTGQMKRFTNGHKTFLAPEAEAFKEFLASEISKRENFLRTKETLIRPRDPLAGEPTPRDRDGAPVLAPSQYGAIIGGRPLFPKDRSPVHIPLPKETIGKIGVHDARYTVLGNKGLNQTFAQPEDLHARAAADHERKMKTQREADLKGTLKMTVDAKRHAAILEKQIDSLRSQLAEKEKELKILKDNFLS